jgi:hypothetical protein
LDLDGPITFNGNRLSELSPPPPLSQLDLEAL